ncbi:MAG: thermonuclease family protein, partial [Ilumatobacter sp.]
SVWLAAVTTIAIPGCGGAERAVVLPADANAVVEYVVDGDTIDVTIGGREERIRFTGIDTPEKARRDTGAPAECFGDEATAYTESLLPVGTLVRLERDVVGRDDYGRILAYVYRVDDGIFVNYEIVRQGYAQPLTIPPNVTFSELMVNAAREAEADDVGLWSACTG